MIINNKRKKVNNNKKYNTNKVNNDIHKYVYNTGLYKKIRLEYLRLNPLCESCKGKGILNFANQVHHIIPISTGKNINEKQQLGFDWNNLMSLCEECHKDKHKEKNYEYLNEYQKKIINEK